jgi:D-2-hydroxyacid dehydrogenase (NADP+)
MFSSPVILLILRAPETIRNQYFQGITTAFPHLTVTLVDNVNKADPHLATADIIITHGPYLEDKADHVLRNAENLKWVQGIGTGVDNIADRPALRREVMVSNIHGVHGAPMAEAAMGLMLALSRQLPRSLANKAQHKWENWPSRVLAGKTVGILGVGVIAEAMAPRFKAFEMTVIGISSSPRPLPGFDRMVDRIRLLEIVPELDYFLILTPYSNATRHIINADVLGAMKSESYLINLARGGVLDEAALLPVLRDQRIAGAALDVYAREPLPPDNPLWDLPNVILTCHQAATNEHSAQNNLPIICENIRRFMASDFAGMTCVVKRIGDPPHASPS